MGIRPFSYGQFGRVPDPPEPPKLSTDDFVRLCLMDEYRDNEDFKRFVDKCSISYGKSLDDVLDSPITWEYYISLQKGGCNAKREDRGADNQCSSTTATACSCQT